MIRIKENNYAFIDSQNLNLGIQSLGWKLDFKRFRIYIKEKYQVSKAFLFIGYLPENERMYKKLESFGYDLKFKPTLRTASGRVKGNCDAELVLETMIELNNFDNAIIATSDGDFYCLVDYLYNQNKLKCVLSPCVKECSYLLRKAGKEKIIYMDKLSGKLEFK